MARYEHLNIYKEAYNLALILYKITSKFPKEDRALWNKLTYSIIDIIELVIRINSSITDERRELFEKLNMKLNLLSIFVRLSNDLSLFKRENVYISILETISKIIKMSKNWEWYNKKDEC